VKYIHDMATDESAASSKQQPLLVLGKITEILDAFWLAQPEMSLGEIQQATGLPTSTVQRLVSNMVAQGLLDRTGDRIRIGVRMSYWAATALKDLDVLAVVNPVLKELRDKTGETACFFKVEQNFRVCVAVAETHHALRRDMYVGKVIPLHVGSAARILLALNPDLAEKILAAPLEPMTDGTVTSPDELRALIAQAKSDGYAITAGEREDSASGLSAPVFDSAGDILGAITISGPTIRMPQTQCEAWIDLLVGYAEQVTQDDRRSPSARLRGGTLRSRLHAAGKKRCPTWLPWCQTSWPPHARVAPGRARASPFGRAMRPRSGVPAGAPWVRRPCDRPRTRQPPPSRTAAVRWCR
jgi:DNA-binding IclR family transcriptional regulator